MTGESFFPKLWENEGREPWGRASFLPDVQRGKLGYDKQVPVGFLLGPAAGNMK